MDEFWSVELSGTCREQSIAQLTVERDVVHPKAQLSPPFAIFLLSQLSLAFRYSAKTLKRFTKATLR